MKVSSRFDHLNSLKNNPRVSGERQNKGPQRDPTRCTRLSYCTCLRHVPYLKNKNVDVSVKSMHCFGVPVSDKYILFFSITAELPNLKNFPVKNEYLQIKLRNSCKP